MFCTTRFQAMRGTGAMLEKGPVLFLFQICKASLCSARSVNRLTITSVNSQSSSKNLITHFPHGPKSKEFGFVLKDTPTQAWSDRLRPTLRLSRNGCMPYFSSCSASAIPECMRMKGEPIDPQDKMTSLDAVKLTDLDDSETRTSTVRMIGLPVLAIGRTRVTRVLVTMWRFLRALVRSSRYAVAALLRVPSCPIVDCFQPIGKWLSFPLAGWHA